MTDEDIIKALGGPTKVAELLGFDKTRGGVQRVQNWIERGIPSKVKLDHARVFARVRRPALNGAAPRETAKAA